MSDVLAQVSAVCATGPCVQVGLLREPPQGDNKRFADDADHFIYCSEGETVQVEVLAKFTHGTNCPGCEHGPRTVTWTVTGATTHAIPSKDTQLKPMTINGTAADGAEATIVLGEASDEISITCTVSGTSQGNCEEYRPGRFGSHGGNHNGASASCTIKLWRMGMEVTGGDAEQDPVYPFLYQTTFADAVTVTATLIGAQPIVPTQNLEPWSWDSAELAEYETLATYFGSAAWSGDMVAPTAITVDSIVKNGCDATDMDSTSRYVIVEPLKRRPGWQTNTVTHSGEEEDWLEPLPDAFPIISGDFEAWAQNTNSDADYEDHNQALFTPVYSGTQAPPETWADFTQVRTEITDGPNLGLWYVHDSAIFEVARKSRINYWITPNALKSPSAPTLGPQGCSYNNWCDIYTALGTDVCGCANPALRGGNVANIRYKANIWHEGYGAPASPNKERLGHQIRMENALSTGNKAVFDAVWKCDLLYSKAEPVLRAAVEQARFQANESLKAESSNNLHIYTIVDPEQHNFRGFVWATDGTDWASENAPNSNTSTF